MLKLALATASIALSLAATAPARSAVVPPSSLTSLLALLPQLPATAEEATRWVDKQGRLIHPGLLALQAAIEAHQLAMQGLADSQAPQQRAQASRTAEDLGTGLADAGIDMARMSSEPAYAAQVQARLQSMSPAQLMAVSQQMARPMNQNRALPNAAQAMVEDAASAREAAQAGEAYANAQPTRTQAQRAIWREADEAVAQVLKTPLAVPGSKPTPEWENIGCTAGCRAQWERYAAGVLPLMLARDTDILRIRRAAVQRQLASISADLRTADHLLAAAHYGAASNSQVNRMNIARYDGAAVAELLSLVNRTADSARSAAAVAHCGVQIVLAPHAVCR